MELTAVMHKARSGHELGRLPLPKGEGWGEGLQTIDRSETPSPQSSPCGERESRRAACQAVRLNSVSKQEICSELSFHELHRSLTTTSRCARNWRGQRRALCGDLSA